MDITITPFSPVGAEIRGVDLSRPLDDATRAYLNEAFAKHSVLCFRGQAMTAPQLQDAVQNFGEVFPQHNARFKVPECPLIHYISNQDTFPDGRRYIPGEGYHTDHSNDRAPPKATILLAVQLPSTGGDTQFVNMYRAYDELPEATKRRLEGLRAIHVYQSTHSERQLPTLSDERKAIVPDAVLQPMVLTHPESGRKALYINPIRIEGILGMDHKEALPLLRDLLDHATQEKFQYRHKWQAGDMVMWDNRCLLHKANGDYDMNETRYLYRVMLKGKVLSH